MSILRRLTSRRRILKLQIFFVILVISFFCMVMIIKVTNVTSGNLINLFNFEKLSQPHPLFADETVEFMQIAKKFNLDVFVIEPSILISVITGVFGHRGTRAVHGPSLAGTTSGMPVTLVSFGVFAKDAKSLEERNFEHNLIKASFSHRTISGEVGSERSWQRKENNCKVPLQYVYVKNDCLIQLVLFYERNEFYWIGAIDDFSLLHSSNKLHYGKNEQAFDKFNLLHKTVSQVSFFIPDETRHFIAQINASRFIECNFDVARAFYSLHPDLRSSRNASLTDAQAREAIKAFKRLTKQLMMVFWLANGTLLGWYRQCGIISYTTDLDFATWASNAKQSVTSRLMHNNAGLELKHIFGFFEDAYQIVMYTPRDRVRLDLFFTYRKSDISYYAAHLPQEKSYFYYFYPSFQICSAELLGLKVHVPCEPEKVILPEFGPWWQEPVKNWSGITSPYNRGQMMHWPDDKVNLSAQHF